ncbi:MAG: hypothetical protein AB1505_24245 [Candidatus Latescibacterota bacterium]
MGACKVAITFPEELLVRVDEWAHKREESLSQFIAGQLEQGLRRLHDEHVTRLYDEAYAGEQVRQENARLAEEMLAMRQEDPEGDPW